MKHKTLKAIALAYNNQTDTSPKILASGLGEIAKAIIEKAKIFDVPIFANPTLANSLATLQIDENIPEELYSSVVEVFIWLDRTQHSAQLSKN
ncbi:EscU/YscU/HrcU family type III secretion system export apparatus switch protein [Helicobacter cappadocius]|uniref:EscU/YscU/HrcU family type III secretion system export apparatus switch protein n=1 Tax=Helicobacter cappadocius TaxID=3063998 RepID=A0AA90PVG7_9HELI|nr:MULTISPECIES: EscU/YscU/HrcU family type III secretion system export apparatus switch protein [unclassified Helicobacter]MDO7253186.1 EscU/YscU/HrcU family type III secretion system export apparatus switch protein [Helicobacter sp. faydin-H75]MDP2539110.1 EscU/YscU/HrcU family type III secretion system export apparatus switch protein [Helicobacter sp. faydin-H76]